MSAKAISEATGKRLLNQHIKFDALTKARFASVNEETDWDTLLAENPWLKTEVHIILYLVHVWNTEM